VKILPTDLKHYLSGDWSISGVVSQVDSLSQTLQNLEADQNKKLHVDCARINKIDMSGLQLLHVWRECASMRGIEARLVNLPEHMQQTIRQSGFEQHFADSNSDMSGGTE